MEPIVCVADTTSRARDILLEMDRLRAELAAREDELRIVLGAKKQTLPSGKTSRKRLSPQEAKRLAGC